MNPMLSHLAIVGSLLLVTPASALAGGGLPASLPNGVAAGDVDQDSVLLWTRSTVPGQVKFEIALDPSFSVARTAFVTVANPDIPAKAPFFRLRPGKLYHYRATSPAGESATGTFRTAHKGIGTFGLRFGVTGDSRGDVMPLGGITNVPSRELDFMVLLGDTIYADVPSPALPIAQATTLDEFRIKHQEVLSEVAGINAMADLRSSTAIYTSIDDHEVTNDFDGGAAPSSDPRFDQNGAFINETDLYTNGLTAYSEYHPTFREAYRETGDPRTAWKRKLYRFRTFGKDAALMVLDARSFRDQNLPPITNPTDPVEITNFLIAAATPGRTLLGQAQLDQLKTNLLQSEQAGIVWKFVLIPEPIQNLGVLAAEDRYEGYAAERAELLAYIAQAGIRNVVFVAADIHGTLVNDVTFQTAPGGPQIPSGAFEVTTGSMSYDAPFGQTVVGIAAALGLLSPAELAFYASLPLAGKDDFVRQLVDAQVTPLGYDALGLSGASINATLLTGGYAAVHTYGWTEFEIDAGSSELLVTTWGVEPTAPLSPPTVISQFRVVPQ